MVKKLCLVNKHCREVVDTKMNGKNIFDRLSSKVNSIQLLIILTVIFSYLHFRIKTSVKSAFKICELTINYRGGFLWFYSVAVPLAQNHMCVHGEERTPLKRDCSSHDIKIIK
jgi:hypothetical protein